MQPMSCDGFAGLSILPVERRDVWTVPAVPQLILTRALATQARSELNHQVEGASVRDAFDALFATHPQLRRYLLTDTGAVRQHVNVFLNDTLIQDRSTLSDVVGASDTIHVIQAVSGGQQ